MEFFEYETTRKIAKNVVFTGPYIDAFGNLQGKSLQLSRIGENMDQKILLIRKALMRWEIGKICDIME